MDRSEALTLLALDETHDHQELLDAYVNLCFEVKNFVLQTTVLPTLLEKRIHHILKLERAKRFLLAEPDNSTKDVLTSATSKSIENNWPDRQTDIATFLKTYEGAMAHCKLALAQSSNGVAIAKAMEDLVRLERQYLGSLFPWSELVMSQQESLGKLVDPEVWEVKAAESANTFELREACRKLLLDQIGVADHHAFSQWLGRQELKGEKEVVSDLDTLVRELVRIHKVFLLSSK